MAQDEEQRIEIKIDSNAKEVAKDTNSLGDALDNVEGSQKKVTKSSKENADALAKNGGAMAILNQLTGGMAQQLKDAYEASDLFSGGVGKMLKSVKTFSIGAKAALISTGIGALVVLVGVLVSYWDDIVGLVSGVNHKMKVQGEIASDNAKESQKQLDILNGQDNILKLQGKTEKEILALKINQTNETIKALEAQILAQKAIKDAQVQASQRNKDILSGMLKFISLPLTGLLYVIDGIGTALGKDFGLVDGFDKVANLLFDPDEVAEKGQKEIDETQKKLDGLKNTVAGYHLAVNEIDKKANEERQKISDDAYAKRKAEEEKRIAEEKARLEKLKSEAEAISQRAFEENERRSKTELEQLEEKYNKEKALLEQSKIDTEQLEIDYLNRRNEINLAQQAIEQGIRDQEIAAKKEADEKLLEQEKALEEARQGIRQAGLSNVESIGKNLQVLAGKNKAVQKAGLIVEGAVGAANIVSNTMQANAKAVAAFPLTGGMPFTAINTVSGALSLAAQIKSVTTGLSALGGGSVSSSTLPTSQASAPPTVAFNNSAENQIGQSMSRSQSENPPMRVYVAESDITNAQNNVQTLVNSNTF